MGQNAKGMTAQEFSPARPSVDDVDGNDLFRRCLHDAVDPWVLLMAVRNADERIADFVYRDLNRAAAGYAGLVREDFLGNSIIERMPDVVSSGLFDLCVRCVETGVPMVVDDFVFQPPSREGIRRYDGRAVRVGTDYLSLTWRDVNDRYEMARRVAESEERYRLLADNSSDVVVHLRDNVVVWAAPSITHALGAPPSFWTGQSIAAFLVAEDLPIVGELLEQTATGKSALRRLRVRDADGKVHWCEVHAKLFYDAEGNPDGRTASLRVIDSEVASEYALEDARVEQARADARYRKLIEHSVVATAIRTPDRRVVTVNQAACDFFGYDEAALLSMDWADLTGPEYLKQVLAGSADIAAGRRDSYRLAAQYTHAGGRPIWGDLSVSCTRGPGGEVEYTISQILDITAEMQARERLLLSDDLNRVLAQNLQAELNSAAHYLRSALPDDLTGSVVSETCYLPSQTLGGDFFDVLWVDDDHLVAYLLDVSGHGVQSALVAVSAYNLMRSSTMTEPTLLHPGRMLGTLNRHFAMEDHDGNYVTIWYGVYEKSTRTLSYANGGHPPAVLFTDGKAIGLPSQSLPAGMFEDTTFPTAVVPIPPGSQLLLYSDGIFEISLPDGGQWSHAQFIQECARLAGSPGWTLDDLVAAVLSRSAGGSFEDDCSLVLLTFG